MTQKSQSERVAELEMSLTHLQRDYDSLNEVILAQQKSIDSLKRQLEHLGSQLEAASDPEVRDPVAEKPPHY